MLHSGRTRSSWSANRRISIQQPAGRLRQSRVSVRDVRRTAELLFRNICITKCFIAGHTGARKKSEKNEAERSTRMATHTRARSSRCLQHFAPRWTGRFAFDPDSSPHEKCIRRVPPSRQAEINISIVHRRVIDFIKSLVSNATATWMWKASTPILLDRSIGRNHASKEKKMVYRAYQNLSTYPSASFTGYTCVQKENEDTGYVGLIDWIVIWNCEFSPPRFRCAIFLLFFLSLPLPLSFPLSSSRPLFSSHSLFLPPVPPLYLYHSLPLPFFLFLLPPLSLWSGFSMLVW